MSHSKIDEVFKFYKRRRFDYETTTKTTNKKSVEVPQVIHNLAALTQDLKSMLETGEHSDVTLVSSDGSEHKAHKVILTCRSKVFSSMFKCNMTESQDNIVKIKDIDKDTIEAMLEFFYTAKVKNIQDTAEKLLIAADKYELNDLKDTCIHHISKTITNLNILDLLELAYGYNICALKIKIKEYFFQNYKEILAIQGREAFKNLSRDVIDDLFYDFLKL